MEPAGVVITALPPLRPLRHIRIAHRRSTPVIDRREMMLGLIQELEKSTNLLDVAEAFYERGRRSGMAASIHALSRLPGAADFMGGMTFGEFVDLVEQGRWRRSS